LQPVKFRGEDLIDPAASNPFQRLIDLRKRKSVNKLDEELRSTGYKTIANSGAYGCFVETTPEDIDPDAPLRFTRVTVRGLRTFEAIVDRPEWHSALCSFPIASLVTAGARLLLSVAEHLVREAEGEVCYDDTDSLMVITRKDGGFVPCEGGPYRLQDGRRAVRALSWAQLDRILDDLAALKVYDPAIVPGSSFKIEDENFDSAGDRRQLWFYGTRDLVPIVVAEAPESKPDAFRFLNLRNAGLGPAINVRFSGLLNTNERGVVCAMIGHDVDNGENFHARILSLDHR